MTYNAPMASSEDLRREWDELYEEFENLVFRYEYTMALLEPEDEIFV